MANLVQAAEELEFVPKNQLAEMSQDPNSRYPSFLVLSEIQRRTQMERMYNAERQAMERPTTTVAEELVGQFIQPQGLAGMAANGSAGASAIPMQMAAGGGRTGYQEGGVGLQELEAADSEYRRQLLGSFGVDHTGMSDQEVEQAIFSIQSNPAATPLVSQVEDADDSGGLGGWFKERYWGDDDEFNLGTAALDALTFVPGIGLLAGAGIKGALWAGKGAKAAYTAGKLGDWGGKLGRGAASTFSRPGTIITKGGKEIPLSSPRGTFAYNMANKPNVQGWKIPGMNRVFAARRAAGTGAGLLAAGTALEYMMDDDEVEAKVNQIVNEGGPPDTGSSGLKKSAKGLSGKVNSYLKQADGLDVAKLGGIIMSSRNTVELGEGITALASDIQTRKTEKEARQDTLKLQEIQGELYTAQTEKYRAEIAAMEPEQLISVMDSLADLMKIVSDTSNDPEELSNLKFKYEMAYKRWAGIKGVDYITEEERMRKALDAAKIQE